MSWSRTALPFCDAHALHAGNRLHDGHEFADKNAFTERKIVGMKEAETSVAQHSGAEHLKHGGFHVAAEKMRQHAHGQCNIQRDQVRGASLQIVADAPIALQGVFDAPEQSRSGCFRSARIDRHLRFIPAAGPLQRRAGVLDLAREIPFRKARVVLRGDGASQDFAKRTRRKQFHLSQRFRIGAADGRKRIA